MIGKGQLHDAEDHGNPGGAGDPVVSRLAQEDPGIYFREAMGKQHPGLLFFRESPVTGKELVHGQNGSVLV